LFSLKDFKYKTFSQVEKTELKGRTLIRVPGYEQPVEFGVMIHFAYPIENSSKYST